MHCAYFRQSSNAAVANRGVNSLSQTSAAKSTVPPGLETTGHEAGTIPLSQLNHAIF